MVALGSKDEGALALTRGEPSSKQKLRASSVYVRLHCGQRFILWPRFVIGTAGQRRWWDDESRGQSTRRTESAQVAVPMECGGLTPLFSSRPWRSSIQKLPSSRHTPKNHSVRPQRPQNFVPEGY